MNRLLGHRCVDSAPRIETHDRRMFFDAKRLYKRSIVERVLAS